MRSRLLHIILGTLALCMALGVSSCGKKNPIPDPDPDPDTPHTAALFSVKFDIKDGLVDTRSVVSKPVVKFTLSSDDDSANYSFTYSIAGGAQKTMKSLWDGAVKDISASFTGLSGYGQYSLKGTFVDIEDAANKVAVDTVVWMKYVPAESTSMHLVTASREEAIGTDEVTLYEGESGVFEFAYSPSTTFLNVAAALSGSNVVSLDQSKAHNRDGVYSIPFTALTIGGTTLTFSTENGPDKDSFKIPIKVVEDTDGKSVSVELEHSGLALPGVPLDVTVTGKCGQTSRVFNIDYFIDGSLSKSDRNVSFSSPVRISLSADDLAEGKHTILVRTSSDDGRLTPIDRESTFHVARPVLSIIDNSTSQEKYYGDGEQVTLPISKYWTLSVKSVPEEYVSRFQLVGSSYDSISGSGPWTLNINRYGRGDITLRYSFGNKDVRIISLNTLRTDSYNLRISYFYSADDSKGEYTVQECYFALNGQGSKYSSLPLTVSGKLVYYGVCHYKKALSAKKEDGYFNEECEKRGNDQYLYYDKNAVFSSKQLLLDASWYADNISHNYETSAYWPDWAEMVWGDDYYHAEPELGTFPYTFVPDSVSIKIISDNDEGLTYVITKDASMSNITCIAEKSNIQIK